MIKIASEQDSIDHVIDVITKTAPPPSGNITFQCAKGNITVVSVSDLSRCQIRMAGKLEGEGEFAVPLQSFRDAIKGRDKLKMMYREGTLTIAAGDYKTALSTVDVMPIDNPSDEEGAVEWILETEQATWLKESLKKVALKPTSMFSTWMPAGIRITSKGAFVACYDEQHLSWIRDKEIKGDFSCLLPMDVLQSVMDVFHQSKFKISHSKSFVKVHNKTIHLILNTPATDDVRPVDEVIEKVKSASGAEGVKLKMVKADVVKFLSNARAVVGKERAEIEFEPSAKEGKKFLKVLVKTVQGTTSVGLPLTGKLKEAFRVDHDYFAELIGKCPEDVELTVVEGAFISVQLKETTALVALNQ